MSSTARLKKWENSLLRILAKHCMTDKEIGIEMDETPRTRDYQGFLFFMRNALVYLRVFSSAEPFKDSIYLKFILCDFDFFLQLMNIYEMLGKMEEKNISSQKPFLVARFLRGAQSVLSHAWYSNHHKHIDRVWNNWRKHHHWEGGAEIGA